MSQKETKVAMYLNQLTEAVLYTMYKQIALDLFEWEGLPIGITTDILEDYLYHHGLVVWFKHETLGLTCLPATAKSDRNIHNQPTSWDVRGRNFTKNVDVANAVRMKNNPLMAPTDQTIRYFIIKLVETERTLDNHVKAHKIARILTCDDNTLLSVKNMVKKIDDNEINILASKSLNVDNIDVLDLEIEFKADKLKDYSNEIVNDLNTFLGINNANTDKKERLITDEVNANDDAIERNIALMLRSRVEAVEEINKMFGSSITVKVAHQPEEVEPSDDEDLKLDIDEEEEES